MSGILCQENIFYPSIKFAIFFREENKIIYDEGKVDENIYKMSNGSSDSDRKNKYKT